MNNKEIILKTISVKKDLYMGNIPIHILRNVSMEVFEGETLSIIGPSGSGKSTLLGLLGGLDSPSEGSIIVSGEDITSLSERELTKIRNEKIGFVFQFFNLIPTLTAWENVAIPIQFSKKKKFNAEKRAKELLSLLKLDERIKHRPTQLSGGEQQRVAIARALANEPDILLCDEPTGNLDSESGMMVLDALKLAQKNLNTTLILVTHDKGIAASMNRTLTLIDGQITKN